MKNKKNLKISSKICSLTPYLDENGIIRVGGRLTLTFDIINDCKRSIMIGLSKDCHISKLIILWCHHKTGQDILVQV